MALNRELGISARINLGIFGGKAGNFQGRLLQQLSHNDCFFPKSGLKAHEISNSKESLWRH